MTEGDAVVVDVQLAKRDIHTDISRMVASFSNATHRSELLGLVEPNSKSDQSDSRTRAWVLAFYNAQGFMTAVMSSVS